MVNPERPKTELADQRDPEATIHAAIARRLGSAILSGDLKPGDCVGGEIGQSRTMGVSRAAYREAIRLLLAKGLLETQAKAGTHVAPRRRWNLLDPEVIAWTFAGNPDPRFIRDLLELRALVEPAAAALAAQRRSEAELEMMRAAIAAMSAHGLDSAAGQEADRQFHNSILAASGNEAFASLSKSIEAAVQWITLYKKRRALWQSDLVDEHTAVFDGIANGDPARARRAMSDLLGITLANVRTQFPEV